MKKKTQKGSTFSLMPEIEDYIDAIKSPQDNLYKLKRFRPFLNFDGSMEFWFNENCIVFRMIDSQQDNYEFGLECCLTNEYYECQRHQILSASNNDIRIFEAELKIPKFSNQKNMFPVILHRKYTRKQNLNEYVPQVDAEKFEISEDGKTLMCWKMPSGIIGKGVLGVIVPEGIEFIAEGAFAGCGNLDVLYLPKSLKKIGRGAFMSCGGFELYFNSEYIEEIDEYAFWGCKLKMKSGIENLSKIIGNISAHAFTNAYIYISCNKEYRVQRVKNGKKWSLEFLKYNSQEEIKNNNTFPNDDSIWNEAVEDIDGVMYDKNFQYVLRCNNRDLTNYKIKESAIGIFPEAFGFIEKLVEIDLSGIKLIGDGAFKYCNNLKSVKLGFSIKYFGSKVFVGTGLEEIKIPPSFDKIPEESFRDCKLLKKVEIPDNIVSIERMAFGNCISLQTINIPKNVITIGELAFCNCPFKEITLPRSLLHMDYSPFCGCYNTKIISESPLFYANEQFLLGYHKTRLISYLADELNIVVPGTVKSLLGYSLLNKNKNARIYIPNSVKYIGHWAFRYAKARQINFPTSVTFVKSSFDYCTSIELYFIDENASELLNGSVSNSKISKYNDANVLINNTI